jgi:hypothetical protein
MTKPIELMPMASNIVVNSNMKLWAKAARATIRSGHSRSLSPYALEIGPARAMRAKAPRPEPIALSRIELSSTAPTPAASSRRSAMNRAADRETPKSIGSMKSPPTLIASA